MPTKLIKIVFKKRTAYIVDLFNYIIKRRQLPKSWKTGRMIYFNKPNRRICKASDLRSITLTNGLCKIVEALFSIR